MTTRQSRTAESRKSKPKTGRGQGFPGWDAGLRQWLMHGFRRNGADLNRRMALSLLLITLLVWLLVAAYLILVSTTMVAARRVQEMRDLLTVLYRENATLENQIAIEQAPAELLWEAQQDGFLPSSRIEHVEP